MLLSPHAKQNIKSCILNIKNYKKDIMNWKLYFTIKTTTTTTLTRKHRTITTSTTTTKTTTSNS